MSRKIIKNASALMLAQVLNPLISLALVITVARVEGAEGLGGYSLALSMVGIFEVIARLGIREYVIREINKTQAQWRAVLTSGLTLGLGSSLLSQAAMLVIFRLAGYDASSLHGLAIISCSLLFSVLYYVFESTLYAFDRMTLVGSISIAETVTRIAVSFGLFALGLGVEGLLWAYVLSQVAAMLLSFGAVAKFIGAPARVWDKTVLQAMLKATPTFFTLAVIASIFWRIDIMVLSRLLGVEAVGQYSAAYRIMYVLVMAGNNLLTAAFPTMTRIFHHGRQNFGLLLEKTGKYLLMLYLPAAVGIAYLSPKIVMLLFGDKFADAAAILRLVIWVALPYTLTKLFTSGLVASNQQHLDLRINTVRLVLNVTLGYVFVLRFGVIGAALGLLLACSLAVLMQLYYLRHMLQIKILLSNALRPVVAAGAMTLALSLTTAWPLLAQIAAGAGVYLVALFALKPFDGEDRRLLNFLGAPPTGEIA